MTRLRQLLVLLLLLVSTTVAARAAIAGESGMALHGGAFFSNCRFSHSAEDDPIVYPREPGRSHHHTFFGNVSTDAYSTRASLRAAQTSCRLRGDTAAYWIPTLYQGDQEVRPSKAQFYYLMRGYSDMRPFPPGLKMIAGDPHALSPQRTRIAYWACGGGAGLRSGPWRSVPRCPKMRTPFHGRDRNEQTFLELHVNFPDCWDGRRLDAPDHQSHMAHSTNYRCPASHPVKLPLIRLNVQYPTTGGEGVRLASGGMYSGHADFFNAWDQTVLTELVNECFRDRCNAAVGRVERN